MYASVVKEADVFSFCLCPPIREKQLLSSNLTLPHKEMYQHTYTCWHTSLWLVIRLYAAVVLVLVFSSCVTPAPCTVGTGPCVIC